MPNGIIIIDKPQGWTSMDVCAKLRGVFHEKRIGHAGTLDPMATGVLPVFVGRATRAVQFAERGEKEYMALFQLGLTTDTQDIWGRTLEEKPVPADAAERLKDLVPQFTGEIEQIPPMYSAVKIQGKKLYELARKGVEVEREPRPVTIHTLELSQVGRVKSSAPDAQWPDTPNAFSLRVACSKGTYIRTLCHDIGQALGCGGAMAALRRTMAAGFTLEDAVTLDQVLAAEDPASLLLPVDAYFAERPMVVLRPGAEKKVRNGAAVTVSGLSEGEYRVYSEHGEFLALSRSDGKTLTTIKSFFEVN